MTMLTTSQQIPSRFGLNHHQPQQLSSCSSLAHRRAPVPRGESWWLNDIPGVLTTPYEWLMLIPIKTVWT